VIFNCGNVPNGISYLGQCTIYVFIAYVKLA